MKAYLAIGLGSAAGGALRWLTVAAALAAFGPAFPVGTLAANTLGSLLIGVLAGVQQTRLGERLTPEARAALGVGFCGGYTTFSFFSFQVLLYSGLGAPWAAAAYVVASIALPLAAVGAGFALGRRPAR